MGLVLSKVVLLDCRQGDSSRFSSGTASECRWSALRNRARRVSVGIWELSFSGVAQAREGWKAMCVCDYLTTQKVVWT